jgi:hypothetical protein
MNQTHTAERPCRAPLALADRAAGTGWDAALDRYHRAAADALNTHLNQGGHCTRCDQVWPCARALAAAFALEL